MSGMSKAKHAAFEWLDRQAGVSNFKVAQWIPAYLRWYRFAFGPRLTAEQIQAHGLKKGKVKDAT